MIGKLWKGLERTETVGNNMTVLEKYENTGNNLNMLETNLKMLGKSEDVEKHLNMLGKFYMARTLARQFGEGPGLIRLIPL